MNNPNPLIPQGSLLQQRAKGKPHLRVAIFIVAVHLVFLGGLLIQGCKKEDETGSGAQALATNDLSVTTGSSATVAGKELARVLEQVVEFNRVSEKAPSKPIPIPTTINLIPSPTTSFSTSLP